MYIHVVYITHLTYDFACMCNEAKDVWCNDGKKKNIYSKFYLFLFIYMRDEMKSRVSFYCVLFAYFQE